MRYAKLIGLAGALLTAGVLAVAGYGSASDRSSDEGVAAGVSSLTRVPAVSTPSLSIQRAVEPMARRAGMTRAQALGSVRILRSNLGALHSDFFAFKAKSGSVCWGMTGLAGSCPRTKYAGSAGFQWTIGAGYETTPGVLAGIAADDVSKIQLFTDGVERRVSIVNNAVFAEYPRSANKAEIVVHRTDGSAKSTEVLLNG